MPQATPLPPSDPTVTITELPSDEHAVAVPSHRVTLEVDLLLAERSAETEPPVDSSSTPSADTTV